MRFYKPQDTQYKDTFVPTEMPWDLVLGAVGREQQTYDKSISDAEATAFKLDNYYLDNNEARALEQQYNQQASTIANDISSTEGSYKGASSKLFKLANSWKVNEDVRRITENKAYALSEQERIKKLGDQYDPIYNTFTDWENTSMSGGKYRFVPQESYIYGREKQDLPKFFRDNLSKINADEYVVDEASRSKDGSYKRIGKTSKYINSPKLEKIALNKANEAIDTNSKELQYYMDSIVGVNKGFNSLSPEDQQKVKLGLQKDFYRAGVEQLFNSSSRSEDKGEALEPKDSSAKGGKNKPLKEEIPAESNILLNKNQFELGFKNAEEFKANVNKLDETIRTLEQSYNNPKTGDKEEILRKMNSLKNDREALSNAMEQTRREYLSKNPIQDTQYEQANKSINLYQPLVNNLNKSGKFNPNMRIDNTTGEVYEYLPSKNGEPGGEVKIQMKDSDKSNLSQYLKYTDLVEKSELKKSNIEDNLYAEYDDVLKENYKKNQLKFTAAELPGANNKDKKITTTFDEVNNALNDGSSFELIDADNKKLPMERNNYTYKTRNVLKNGRNGKVTFVVDVLDKDGVPVKEYENKFITAEATDSDSWAKKLESSYRNINDPTGTAMEMSILFSAQPIRKKLIETFGEEVSRKTDYSAKDVNINLKDSEGNSRSVKILKENNNYYRLDQDLQKINIGKTLEDAAFSLANYKIKLSNLQNTK
jgi:hypothetical protein